MNVDAALPEWNVQELEALDGWRQGHLVRAPNATWVDVRSAGDGGAPEVTVRADPGAAEGIPYALVVSQTCDVVGSGPGARHPFVQVAPLRDVSDWPADRLAMLQRHELNDYILLTKPPKPEAVWAADLRMSWPLSKRVLTTEEPVVAFAEASDERYIGVHLSRKFERPAFPDLLTTDVAHAFQRCVERGLKKPYLLIGVIQIRLHVMSGTALHPGDVRIIVVSDHPLNPDEMEPLRVEWAGFRKKLDAAGMTWVEMAFRTLDTMTGREYRDSSLLNISKLHSGRSNR